MSLSHPPRGSPRIGRASAREQPRAEIDCVLADKCLTIQSKFGHSLLRQFLAARRIKSKTPKRTGDNYKGWIRILSLEIPLGLRSCPGHLLSEVTDPPVCAQCSIDPQSCFCFIQIAFLVRFELCHSTRDFQRHQDISEI